MKSFVGTAVIHVWHMQCGVEMHVVSPFGIMGLLDSAALEHELLHGAHQSARGLLQRTRIMSWPAVKLGHVASFLVRILASPVSQYGLKDAVVAWHAVTSHKCWVHMMLLAHPGCLRMSSAQRRQSKHGPVVQVFKQ